MFDRRPDSRRTPSLLAGVVALVAMGALVAACGGGDGSTGDGSRPTIVATTSILGDVVGSLVGDDADVDVLMPAGVDPHDFELSAQEAARLRGASLVVANGLGLESGIRTALDSAIDDGVDVLEVAPHLDPLPFGASSRGHDDGDDHDDGHEHDLDPHVWHDPLRMASAVPLIVDALVAAAPELDTAALADRAEALVAALHAVDEEVVATLDVVPDERRVLLTNHDTFGYFAARYDFEVIGAVIPGGDTLARPSASELADLVAEIEAHELPAIFAEEMLSTALADALAAEVDHDVEVVTLFTDSLGPPGSEAETYVEMLRTNARLVADALS